MVDPQKVAEVKTLALSLGLPHGVQLHVLKEWKSCRESLGRYTPAGQVQEAEPAARPRHTPESGDRITAAGSVQPEPHEVTEASFLLTSQSLGFLVITQGMLTLTGI